jgi:molecular chaperone DnaK
VRKSLTEHGDKLDAAEKDKIEAAIKATEEALKSDDKAAIDAAAAELMTASQKIGEKVYASEQAAGAAGAAAAGAASGAGAGAADADVVDAEFKEVKRDA